MTTDHVFCVANREYILHDRKWTWEPDPQVSNADRINDLCDALLDAHFGLETLADRVRYLERIVARDGQAGA